MADEQKTEEQNPMQNEENQEVQEPEVTADNKKTPEEKIDELEAALDEAKSQVL